MCDCAVVDIRLAGGSTYEGRLEIKVAGKWGTVCDDSFDNYDASVACSMLGYGYVLAIILHRKRKTRTQRKEATEIIQRTTYTTVD